MAQLGCFGPDMTRGPTNDRVPPAVGLIVFLTWFTGGTLLAADPLHAFEWISG